MNTVKKILFFFLLPLSFANAPGQNTTFELSLRASVTNDLIDIATAWNGETAVLGKISTSQSPGKHCLFSILPTAQVSWQRYIPDSVNLFSQLTSLNACADSGFIVAGKLQTMINSTIQNGIYLEKINSVGQTEWSKFYVSPNAEYPTICRQTMDGGFIFTGYSTDPSFQNTYFILIKTDAAGNMLWNRQYQLHVLDKAFPWDVHEDKNGDYYICGDFDDQAVILKTSHGGNLLWVKEYPQQGPTFVQLTSMTRSNSGNEVVCAGFYAGGGVCMEIDTLGNVNWMRNYFSSSYLTPSQIIPGTNGNEYGITGHITSGQVNQSPGFLLRVDNAGNSLSFNSYSTDYGGAMTAIDSLQGGGYVMGGEHYQPLSTNTLFYIVRADTTGKVHCNENKLPVTDSVPPFTTVPHTPTITTPFITYDFLLPWVESSISDSLICIFVDREDAAQETGTFWVYPNPADDWVSISGPETIGSVSLSIFSVDGKLLYSSKERLPQTVNISEFPGGILILEISAEGKIFHEKILKH